MNLSLSQYLLVAIISATLIILGGFASFSMMNLIEQLAKVQTVPPRSISPSLSVKALEVYSITTISTYAASYPSKWVQIQTDLRCCGFTNSSTIDWYIDPDVGTSRLTNISAASLTPMNRLWL